MIRTLLLTAGAAALTFTGAQSYAAGHGDHGSHKGHKAEKAISMNIVETAASNPDFSTLVAAVKAAGLVDALSSDGPLTVFAPTNEAFAKLPEGTLDDLLKPENKDKLASILKYHVVSGKVKAGDIATGESNVATLQGASAQVVKGDNGVTVDGANVVKADLKTSNGVIHVIDKVILPK